MTKLVFLDDFSDGLWTKYPGNPVIRNLYGGDPFLVKIGDWFYAWHDWRVAVEGRRMSLSIDARAVGQVQSSEALLRAIAGRPAWICIRNRGMQVQ